MLKVLQVPFTFAPDPIGGTEIYVESLGQQLRSYDIESVICAPSAKGIDEHYDFNGLSVYRYCYATDSPHFLRELYGEGDPTAASAFARILEKKNNWLKRKTNPPEKIRNHLRQKSKAPL